MRPAIRVLHAPTRHASQRATVLTLRYEQQQQQQHTGSSRIYSNSGNRKAASTHQNQRHDSRVQRAPGLSQRTTFFDTSINTEEVLCRIVSQPSTSSTAPTLDASTLQIFFLSWQASPAFTDSESSKRLAAYVETVYGLSARWVLSVMKRMQLLVTAAAADPDLRVSDVLSVETKLLVALHQNQVLDMHQTLQDLFSMYASQPSTRQTAFSLLDLLAHCTESFVQHVELNKRVEVSSLLENRLRRPRTSLARHQLFTFFLSDSCQTLLAHPSRRSDFSTKTISQDLAEAGRDRADELARSQLSSSLQDLNQAQHLHWIQNSKARPKFRATALEAFFRLGRHQRVDGKQQLKLVNLVAETAMSLLPLGQHTRAVTLMQLWDGQRTQLYWFALIKVAAAADQEPVSHPQDLHSSDEGLSSPNLQNALDELQSAQTEMTPAIFVALLTAARHNIAWINTLSRMAQSEASLVNNRRVQEAVVESVLACFEHHRQDLELAASAQTDTLYGRHRSTRVAALQGRVQEAVDGAIQAMLQASGVRTGNEAQHREMRLTSILVRATSAALTHGRIDLALDLMLTQHVPPHLLSYQSVQRVASASAQQGAWDGNAGIARICQLFDKCERDTLAAAFHRPKMVFDLLQVAMVGAGGHAEEEDGALRKELVGRTQVLLESFKDLISKEQLTRWVQGAKGNEQVKSAVLMKLARKNASPAA